MHNCATGAPHAVRMYTKKGRPKYCYNTADMFISYDHPACIAHFFWELFDNLRI